MTNAQKAQVALVKASELHAHMLKQAEEDPTWVGRNMANITDTLGELINAVGHLTGAKKK